MLTLINDPQYRAILEEIKSNVVAIQTQIITRVNTDLLTLYWFLGNKIYDTQTESTWGEGFINQLASDLQEEFETIKGFSPRNLRYIKRWYIFYKESEIKLQQAVAKIPWGHNIAIIERINDLAEAEFYVYSTLENGWSRNVLIHQIESDLYSRKGKIVSNFKRLMPPDQAELVQQLFKDPYVFDFLFLSEEVQERELEKKLIEKIKDFILELGKGFAFVGEQYLLKVNDNEFYIDLLFYHTILKCFIVFELKIDNFKPEYLGQLNFYISTVDKQVKQEDDKNTIGILLCKDKDNLVVEYALDGYSSPIGVAKYELDKVTELLPSKEEITTMTTLVDAILLEAKKHAEVDQATSDSFQKMRENINLITGDKDIMQRFSALFEGYDLSNKEQTDNIIRELGESFAILVEEKLKSQRKLESK